MILAILQARISSSRLPGKVLKKICGKAMLALQIERINRSCKIEKLIVATSIEASDDPIEKLCQKLQVNCFRGDLNNVLNRFYHAALTDKPKHVVRLTGDCPVIDPAIVDSVIQYHLDNDFDYTSNSMDPTFPDGLGVEIMKFSALQNAYENANLPSQLEHVTQFINQKPDCFKLGSYKNTTDLSMLRWTVDQAEDFELICWIYDQFYKKNPYFDMDDIVKLLDKNPEKKLINNKFERNEGLKKSLKMDQELLARCRT